MTDRQSMDDSPKELTGGSVPDREDSAVRSSENEGSLIPGREAATQAAAISLTGMTIGHYLVEERLGGGAMAMVYRAHDQILDHRVAIKVLLPGSDSVMQTRFRREARLVSTLMHPHIVRTLQVGRSGGIIYIAMELVEGASLGEVLEHYGKLSVADAAHILAPVAEALAYAHDKGIIHRDVKPSNILLQRAVPGSANSVVTKLFPYPVIPLLSDFGIPRALDAPELTSAGRTIGTPAFMAPEQCAGSGDIDGRADIYALGAVLYRCLVGRPPFAGTTTQILHAHVYDPLLIPDSIAELLPAPVVSVMARAMMKDPSQRFATVDLMATELQDVAELPETPAVESTTNVADSTMTMASLPVTPSPATATSRVLVPAATVGTSHTSQVKVVPRVPASGTAPPRSIPLAPLSTARTRLQRNRWSAMALGGTLLVLVLLLAATLVYSWVLRDGDDDLQAGESTPTSAVMAVGGTPAMPTPIPEVSPEQTESVPAPTGTRAAPGQNSDPTAVPTPTGTTAAPTPFPTPSVSLAYAWQQAQEFYDEGAWQDALEWLNMVDRILFNPLQNDATAVPSPNEIEINEGRVNEMFVISYIGLATRAATSGRWEAVLAYLDKAIEIVPNDTAIARLQDSFAALSNLAGSKEVTVDEQRQTLREQISGTFVTYADQLLGQDKVCDALFQVNNALAISDSEELQDRQIELDEECQGQKATDSIVETGGNILYSSEANGYNIYRVAITHSSQSNLQSVLLVANGTQPRLSPNGSILAYHNRPEGGLWGQLMGDGPSVLNSSPIRFTANAEDSRDGPPSWNNRSTLLAYSASFNNGPPHVYVTTADANMQTTDLKVGKDPTWHPFQDLLVFNGFDLDGSNPGLKVMSADGDGSDRRPLTNNGNDQRPTWSPDGQTIVFMSKDRGNLGNNWELYRYQYATGETELLTDGDPAQDGLPAISPDGRWVVFMSDRGGRWKLWYVSIDGGPVYLLSDISGQPVAWLEHAIQWVR